MDALEELADSMRANGQIQACVVFEKPNGRFEITAGARRWRAAQILEWPELRCEISDAPDEERRAAVKLIENVQRENLTPVEEAYGLLQLVAGDEIDLRKLQRTTGKSRNWIKSRLELLDLPDDCQKAIQAGLVSMGVGKALGTIANETVRLQYLKHAADSGLSTESAIAWASQAEFAEAGVLAMQDHERRQELADDMPQLAGQRYTCFSCRVDHDTAGVNFLVVCRSCQTQLADPHSREHHTAPPHRVDISAKMGDDLRALQE